MKLLSYPNYKIVIEETIDNLLELLNVDNSLDKIRIIDTHSNYFKLLEKNFTKISNSISVNETQINDIFKILIFISKNANLEKYGFHRLVTIGSLKNYTMRSNKLEIDILIATNNYNSNKENINNGKAKTNSKVNYLEKLQQVLLELFNNETENKSKNKDNDYNNINVTDIDMDNSNNSTNNSYKYIDNCINSIKSFQFSIIKPKCKGYSHYKNNVLILY